MKTSKKIFLVLFLFTFVNFNSYLYCQEWESQSLGSSGVTMDFINANTGFVGLRINGGYDYAIYKTVNKGLNFSLVWTNPVTTDNSKGFGIDMINDNVGFMFIESKLLKTTNGGTNWTELHQIRYNESYEPTIKFYNENLGFVTYTAPSLADNSEFFVYRFTNGGNNYSSVFTGEAHRVPVIKDIAISSADPSKIIMVGFYIDHLNQGLTKRFSLVSSDGGSSFNPTYTTYYNTDYSSIAFLPGSSTDYRIIGGYYVGGLSDPVSGTYCFNSTDAGVQSKVTNIPEISPGISFINENVGYAYVGDTLYKTTNSGTNWIYAYAFNSASNSNKSALVTFNSDIVYTVGQEGNFVTHKLLSYLYSKFDNQSSSGNLVFDNISYNTPITTYLRGGNSILSSSILNSGQSNERLFYKWQNNSMANPYEINLENPGNSFENYYKTKQLSSTSSAISSVSQTKVLKDEWGAINQIHQSIDGGIFYTKSYDNGGNFKREEIVNATTTHSVADGNKNPSLSETKWYGALGGGYPVNKNVSACWERYNSSNGTTEIKVAVRSYDIYSDTSFKWNSWEDGNNSDVFASFSSSASYNSFPKIFASALDPNNYLGEPSTYFFAIPHLRPYQGGNKLVVSCRKGPSLAADFVLDSGDISDLAVIDSIKNPAPGNILIHFAYRKVNQIIYRKELFMYQSGLPIGTYHYEGPKDVTTGDGGYPARLTPDISIMNGIPVITYAANYNAYRIVEFEDNSTSSFTVDRYPIVKVHRINANTWGNYVIYSSNYTQSNPDIEGSKNTRSYIINYNINNTQFKKVANVENYPGYFCSPNTYTGTDSRLVANSYNGSFGSNLSLLTLSPQSSLYKIDKQNFVITNHNPIETFDVDNVQGVVSSDSIRYSFKLGPIFVQDNGSNEEVPVGPTAPPEQDPILNSIEFNENLRSQPFLLNETNPLLVSSNAVYLKDNSYYSITEIPYTVKLINKRTDTLHRVLYQDTIHAGDSIETEYLRGFYISDIPNGEDSFYVKLDVDENFDDAAYYINPIYDDEYDTEGDNPSNRPLAIIFEDKNNININSLKPIEYSLIQNYPNPFNPSTTIQYSIPKDVWVNIRVYDISGREVTTLVNEYKTSGNYSTRFDGNNLASGIYYYRIDAGEFKDSKKMLLIK
ncbi:MAG: T9SS type A sorting domain-containing protein [Ignavibacteriae bacterium]|nr:T9SS type A sorting domain-containing protein [Ignavibacteriota bacterium]